MFAPEALVLTRSSGRHAGQENGIHVAKVYSFLVRFPQHPCWLVTLFLQEHTIPASIHAGQSYRDVRVMRAYGSPSIHAGQDKNVHVTRAYGSLQHPCWPRD